MCSTIKATLSLFCLGQYCSVRNRIVRPRSVGKLYKWIAQLNVQITLWANATFLLLAFSLCHTVCVCVSVCVTTFCSQFSFAFAGAFCPAPESFYFLPERFAVYSPLFAVLLREPMQKRPPFTLTPFAVNLIFSQYHLLSHWVCETNNKSIQWRWMIDMVFGSTK